MFLPVGCRRSGRLVIVVLTRSDVEDRRVVLGDDVVRCGIMGTTRTEHERIDAHSYVISLRFDALVDEHASALDSVHPTRLRTYLIGSCQRKIQIKLKKWKKTTKTCKWSVTWLKYLHFDIYKYVGMYFCVCKKK